MDSMGERESCGCKVCDTIGKHRGGVEGRGEGVEKLYL